MLDSISRPHFYRILQRAAESLRKIVQDPNVKATVLDFELVQSIGQQTFENLRPFFSGVLKGELTAVFFVGVICIAHTWRGGGVPFVNFIDLCNITGCAFSTVLGVQGWRSGESARLPPLWPGFDFQTRRHMWVEFVVGSCPGCDGFFSEFSGFPPSTKTNTSKF